MGKLCPLARRSGSNCIKFVNTNVHINAKDVWGSNVQEHMCIRKCIGDAEYVLLYGNMFIKVFKEIVYVRFSLINFSYVFAFPLSFNVLSIIPVFLVFPFHFVPVIVFSSLSHFYTSFFLAQRLSLMFMSM